MDATFELFLISTLADSADNFTALVNSPVPPFTKWAYETHHYPGHADAKD